MPIEIDVDQRLADLADATVAVARREGIDGVTIRAVAAQLGGSTKMITNYLPTRRDLIANALRHTLQGWNEDLARAVQGVDPADWLRAAARWATTTTDLDVALRPMILELTGRPAMDDVMAPMRDDARAQRAEFAQAARDAGSEDADTIADAVFLMLRGFYVVSLEDPEEWDSERVDRVIGRVIDAFTRGGDDRGA